MLNSQTIRVLLCVVLCCVAVVASIPGGDVTLRVGGAESLGPDHYIVSERTIVSLSVQANRGDAIWVYATGSAGDTVTLIYTERSDGRAYAEFKVPVGTAGRSYKIHAVAKNPDGRMSEAPPVLVDVRPKEAPPANLILDGA